MNRGPDKLLRQALEDLDALKSHAPDEPAYLGTVLSAIAHAGTAVLMIMNSRPEIPGLPPGYALRTRQDEGRSRKWGYWLDCPDGPHRVSRYRWETSEAALAAGIRAARADAQELAQADALTSADGIANPEAD